MVEKESQSAGRQLIGSLAARCSAPPSWAPWRGGPTRGEPFLQRGLAFPGWLSGKETFDTNVFVECVPVDALSSADQSPVLAFCRSGMYEPWKPGEWDGETSPITELHRQGVFRYDHRFRSRY